MGKKFKAKVFLTEYGIFDALESGKVDIALLDSYQQPTDAHFCFVYLTLRTAEGISSALDRAVPGGVMELYFDMVKLVLREKRSEGVIELLRTEFEIELITA